MTSRAVASTSAALPAMLSAVAKTAARLCEARDAQISLVEGDHLRLVARHGFLHSGRTLGATYPLGPTTPLGDALSKCRIIHIRDMAVAVGTRYPEMAAIQGRDGSRTVLAAPMLRDGTPIGGIVIRRRVVRPFTAKQIALLKTFADQAALAIENARLSEQLEAQNRALTDALEQQTATSEILRVISSSPTELQPVMAAVAENAARVCGANDAMILRLEGTMLHPAAVFGRIPGVPVSLSRQTPAGRSVIDRKTLHIHDIAAVAATEYPESPAAARGVRTLLATPLLSQGVPIGAIAIRRMEVQPFTDQQIALLQTFAAQAVIAIENVRLFTELQARNRDLTEALEQQTATSEILGVISSSPTDVQPVFDAIAASAVRLCDAAFGCVYRFDGELLHFVAQHNFSPEALEVMKHRYPLAPTGLNIPVIVDRTVVHAPDVLSDPRSANRDLIRALGYRSFLAVPMLREGQPIGSITVFGAEPKPFSAKQIALLQTFAAQAVIAIENVRLFTELEARNRDLIEALEQQTATSAILRVISASPTDVQPILDAIAEHSTRLCGALFSSVYRFDGDLIHMEAHHNYPPLALERSRQYFPTRPSRQFFTARAILERAVIHVADVQQDKEYAATDFLREVGFRSVLSVPMLRDGHPIGAITVWRAAAGPFADKQIGLLETFADQAVIAIENVRLFKELETRNRDLSEALDQQTATGEILRVISSSPTDVQPVLAAVAESAAKLCGAVDALVVRVATGVMHRVAHFGEITSVSEARPVTPDTPTGRAIVERRAIHVADIVEELARGEYLESRSLHAATGFRTVLAVPLIREDEVVGAITIRRLEVRPFTEKQIALVKTFADQAVIAIENVRLFTELQTRNRELTDALEQQTATGEILRAISSSPTDAQPVFETIVRSAVGLCNGRFANVFRLEGDIVHLAAHYNVPVEALEQFRRTFPQPLAQGGTLTAQAMRHGTVVQIQDVELESDVAIPVRALTRAAGYRSVLAVPIVRRGGSVVGAIGIGRSDATGGPRPFSEKEIALLQTFADQAVIAIENVRLFNELQARTTQLTRSVDQLTALGEVSRALSSTLDLETVLQTIVARANQLAGTDACSVSEYDEAGQEFRLRATNNLDEEVVAVARRTPIRKGEGVQGRMAITRQPVQISDIVRDNAYRGPLRDVLLRSGARALLAIPLLREDHLVGSLTVTRNTPGEFSPETIELLQTFATQSALAIQNARLFREIEEQSRQLEVASRHKSQFLANMSHELRTPLNAILGYTELIADNIYGQVPEKMGEVLERVDKSGRHLLGLINDILDLSKIEAGQLTLALNDYAMQDVIRSVASATEPLARAKGLGLEIAVPDDLPIGHADERRLMQVLLNLVGNAIKFTEAGKVAIRANIDGDAFRVAVADTGPGIAEGDRERIFEEFQQADSAVARVKGGTGLGLAIAQRIIEMHGGRLSLESTLGAGSTFSFTVPVRVEHQVAVAARRPAS